MKDIKLKDGRSMPVIGLGTWQLKGSVCTEAVRKALGLGYRHIDTAEVYGNHEDIGKALKDHSRSEIFLTTKVWRSDLRHDDLISACDRALKEIGTDYIDLYLVHWPNDKVPLKETMDTLGELVSENRVRSIGVSNFDTERLKHAEESADIPPAVNQVEFHPYLYQKELLKYANGKDIILTAYSPTARGDVADDRLLNEIGKEHGKTAVQVSLRWLVQHGLAAIPKSSGSHLEENIDVFSWKLSKKEMDAIDSIKTRKRLVNPAFNDNPFFRMAPKPVIEFASGFF